ncbi:putative B3 domain-containing protein [Spatholobus suberectus]|nr:putative B3 domain-containing protein [Spatholobus suberectus]
MAEIRDTVTKRKRSAKIAREMKEIGSEGIRAAATLADMTRHRQTHHQGGDTWKGGMKREHFIIPSEPHVPILKNIMKDGKFSNPFEKRLGEKDGIESLFLSKREVEDCVLEFLKEGEDLDKKPMPVTVYDKDGNIYEMMFKKWEEKGYCVANGGKRGWTAFYNDHGLARGDFVAVWAFRHAETQLLCFVLISRREDHKQEQTPPQKIARDHAVKK